MINGLTGMPLAAQPPWDAAIQRRLAVDFGKDVPQIQPSKIKN